MCDYQQTNRFVLVIIWIMLWIVEFFGRIFTTLRNGANCNDIFEYNMRPSREHQYKLYQNGSVSRVRQPSLVNVLSMCGIHCLIALILIHFQSLGVLSCVLIFF